MHVARERCADGRLGYRNHSSLPVSHDHVEWVPSALEVEREE